MCIPADPTALATQACVLCSRVRQQPACHHLRGICTQRQNHPGLNNISYFTNAEYDVFNGCGFCKFAQALAAGKVPHGKNRGFPGCCRPPTDADTDIIPDACWPAVAAFWKVPIPEKVLRRISPRSLQQLQLRKEDGGSPTTSKLSLKTAGSMPGDRKSSPPTPGSRNSKLTNSPTDTVRRSVDPSRPPIPSSIASPTRSSQPRSGGTNGTPSRIHPSQVHITIDQSNSPPPPPPPPKPSPATDDLTKSFARINVSRSGSYDPSKRNSIGSMSSLSEATCSDFTDYLSDASDQRMQKEVEERVTQKWEEREFFQARSKVAHMDLQPPDFWAGRADRRYAEPVQVAGGRRSH
ncbi:hypothetical protein DACRYDRAFT_113168 [Dacryopinax primogenitus]|uniref:Uncharacterized protein n=1 Tax=Dacryopinax primogenitus (strain DJM 731) TaxID=1858805 RepID=M5GCW4_DACPD|nr:uncharacterized protein DACRYDRAFT_113168 [Dacryopinax primogenitus]EJU06465.1 hypothetical protein DACRYDRAFT_113168 [Dacryopinax primogenitus]